MRFACGMEERTQPKTISSNTRHAPSVEKQFLHVAILILLYVRRYPLLICTITLHILGKELSVDVRLWLQLRSLIM